MITLKVTITGKNAQDEYDLWSDLKFSIHQLNRDNPYMHIEYETVEETIPLTLELAAQRVLDELGRGGGKGGRVDDLRRVLAGEYVCVPKESAP